MSTSRLSGLAHFQLTHAVLGHKVITRLIIPYEFILLYSGPCTTVGGPHAGSPCVFPFIFAGKQYSTCTLDSADDGLAWCSIRTDVFGQHVKGWWGVCPAVGCGDGEDVDPEEIQQDLAEPPQPATTGVCSRTAVELLDLVNGYRASAGLTRVANSCSLCAVADAHTDEHNAGVAEAHSWANCNFDRDPNCMWGKPQELTNYPGRGYENFAWSSNKITPAKALDLWKNSPGHNAVMLNQGIFTNLAWKAMGASVSGGYAVLWFGEEEDINCEQEQNNPMETEPEQTEQEETQPENLEPIPPIESLGPQGQS